MFNTNATETRVIEAFLIQSYGKLAENEGEQCSEGKGIFMECRTIKGWQGNACGNCKRRDHAARCSLSDTVKADAKLLEEEQVATTEVTTRSGRTTKAPAKYSKEIFRI